MGGAVLAGVNFATDYGDTHPSLDKVQNATIKARDLRLRLELFNMPGDGPLPALALDEVNTLDLGTIGMDLVVPMAVFDDYPARGEVSRQGDHWYLDVVLYQGEEQAIHFGDIKEAAILLALNLRPQGSLPRAMDVRYEVVDGVLKAQWALHQGETLALEMFLQPGTRERLHSLAPTRGG